MSALGRTPSAEDYQPIADFAKLLIESPIRWPAAFSLAEWVVQHRDTFSVVVQGPTHPAWMAALTHPALRVVRSRELGPLAWRTLWYDCQAHPDASALLEELVRMAPEKAGQWMGGDRSGLRTALLHPSAEVRQWAIRALGQAPEDLRVAERVAARQRPGHRLLRTVLAKLHGHPAEHEDLRGHGYVYRATSPAEQDPATGRKI